MMVAILGGLQSISGDLYEAAEMDGASPWQRFRNITLPGLRPVSSTVILLGTIWTFNMFPIIFFVTGGEPAGQSEILVTGAYRAAFEGVRNYSLAATYGVLILSILVVFAAVYRRTLKARERCSDVPMPPAEPIAADPPTAADRRAARPRARGPSPLGQRRAARHADRRHLHRAVPGAVDPAQLVQARQPDPDQRDHADRPPDPGELPRRCSSTRPSRPGSSTPSSWRRFTMVIGIAMSATCGYALSRFNFAGKRGLMWVFLLTQMFPVAILIVPIYTIMANLGLIDTKASLIIAYCTVAVPFCAWMLRGYFDTIPRSSTRPRRSTASVRSARSGG